MKLTRFCVVVASTALIGTAAHAGAAPTKPKPKPKPNPKPVAHTCHLVTDPAGDANGINPDGRDAVTHAGPSDDGLDVLSLDLATNSKTMIWILALKKLTLPSATAPTGTTWRIHFTIRSTTFTVAGHANATGTTFDASYVAADGTTGDLPLPGSTLDPAHNQIRVFLPLSSVAAREHAPLTAKISGIGAIAGQEVWAQSTGAGVAPFWSDAFNAADWTDHDATYTPGKPVRCG